MGGAPQPAGHVSERLEERKLQLEERRFDLDRQKFEFEKSRTRGIGAFINNNLGIVVTAIVGIATIVVSYLQLQITRKSGADQLQLQKSISVEQLNLESRKAKDSEDADQQTFQFGVAKLLLEREQDMKTENVGQVRYLRNIVIATLPPVVSLRITKSMAQLADTADIRSAWNDGYVSVQLLNYPVNHTVVPQASHQPAITADLVLKLFPSSDTADRARVEGILRAAQKAGLTDQNTLAILFACVLGWTGYFHYTIENLDYSNPQRLTAIWPKFFPTAADAIPYVHNPEALANTIYGVGQLGNTEKGDGWKFRGRGYLSTTGRSMYARSSLLVGIDLLKNPDALNNPDVAAQEAVATFAQLGPSITLLEANRKITGSLIGIARLQALYEELAHGAPKVTTDISVTP